MEAFFYWIGVIVFAVIVLYLVLGVARTIRLWRTDDIPHTWVRAIEAIVLWPLSFWKA